MTTTTEHLGPKRPEVVVQLTGEDGNAFFIIARVSKSLRAAGYAGDIAAFQAAAMAGDYDHVIQTCIAWVTVK